MASGTYVVFDKDDKKKYKYSQDHPKGNNSVDNIADSDSYLTFLRRISILDAYNDPHSKPYTTVFFPTGEYSTVCCYIKLVPSKLYR